MDEPSISSLSPPASSAAKVSLGGILRAFRTVLIFTLGPIFAYGLVATAVRLIHEDSLHQAKRKCRRNLGSIEGAKEQFALEHSFNPGHPVTLDDIWRSDGTGYLKEFPKEPLGGSYQINPVGVDAVCVDHADTHNLDFDPATWVPPPCE